MTNERFFRMLSVAILGLGALAVVPNSHATDAQVTATVESVDALPIEVTIVREVEDINAGRFNTASAGEPKETSIVVGPLMTTTISQANPNL